MTRPTFHVGDIFLNQGTSSTIFAQIFPNLAEKNWKQTWSPWKNVWVFIHFAQISTDFARILRDFAQIFTKLKVLGMRLHLLHPRLLHQWVL